MVSISFTLVLLFFLMFFCFSFSFSTSAHLLYLAICLSFCLAICLYTCLFSHYFFQSSINGYMYTDLFVYNNVNLLTMFVYFSLIYSSPSTSLTSPYLHDKVREHVKASPAWITPHNVGSREVHERGAGLVRQRVHETCFPTASRATHEDTSHQLYLLMHCLHTYSINTFHSQLSSLY